MVFWVVVVAVDPIYPQDDSGQSRAASTPILVIKGLVQRARREESAGLTSAGRDRVPSNDLKRLNGV